MFKWYRLFNKTEFESTGLTSYEFEVELQDLGLKTIMITKGNLVSIVYDDVFLPINLNDKNPYRYGTKAVSLDANNDVWLGVYFED